MCWNSPKCCKGGAQEREKGLVFYFFIHFHFFFFFGIHLLYKLQVLAIVSIVSIKVLDFCYSRQFNMSWQECDSVINDIYNQCSDCRWAGCRVLVWLTLLVCWFAEGNHRQQRCLSPVRLPLWWVKCVLWERSIAEISKCSVMTKSRSDMVRATVHSRSCAL